MDEPTQDTAIDQQPAAGADAVLNKGGTPATTPAPDLYIEHDGVFMLANVEEQADTSANLYTKQIDGSYTPYPPVPPVDNTQPPADKPDGDAEVKAAELAAQKEAEAVLAYEKVQKEAAVRINGLTGRITKIVAAQGPAALDKIEHTVLMMEQ